MSNRRVKLKANKKTGHVHVLDAVSGEELGTPIPKRHLADCLEEFEEAGEAGDLFRKKITTGKALSETAGLKGQLADLVAARMVERDLTYSEALREITAENPRLWQQHREQTWGVGSAE